MSDFIFPSLRHTGLMARPRYQFNRSITRDYFINKRKYCLIVKTYDIICILFSLYKYLS